MYFNLFQKVLPLADWCFAKKQKNCVLMLNSRLHLAGTKTGNDAKARVTQMASKLYCQLKALHKTAPLGATNSIKVHWPTVLICVSCLLCLVTGNFATSRFRNLHDISFGFDIWEKRNWSKLSAISRIPLFRKKFRKLSKIFCKNRWAYRRINTVGSNCNTAEECFAKV